MTKAERERRHQANLARINEVQCLAGSGDQARIDHEATLLERARMLAEEMRSHAATELGLAALDRLLRVADARHARHARDVATFLTALWTNKPLPLAALRGLDPAIGDDMLAVLDAWRWARMNLVEQVEGGPKRVARVLEAWRTAAA